jgi:hypothetical protein
MAYENNDTKKQDSVYSKRIKAGKRRTYFFDVRETKASDYYVTITESRKRFDNEGYDRHKIFLYKEDFNKFVKGLSEAVDFVKTELMPNFDFDAFSHENYEDDNYNNNAVAANKNAEIVDTNTGNTNNTPENSLDTTTDNGVTEAVDKW